MQSTVRPTRFITPTAPSSSRIQSPSVRASHFICRQPPDTFGTLRDRITTDLPNAIRCVASEIPRKPLPPAITIGPTGDDELITTSVPKLPYAVIVIAPTVA